MVRWETTGSQGVDILNRQEVDERHRQDRRRAQRQEERERVAAAAAARNHRRGRSEDRTTSQSSGVILTPRSPDARQGRRAHSVDLSPVPPPSVATPSAAWDE